MAFNNYVVSAFRSAKDHDVDGLIGADVFRKFLITIDFPRTELLLEPFPGPPPADEPEDAPPLPSGFFRAIRAGSHLMVFTQVNESAGHPFLLDSGGFSNLINTALASEVTKVHPDDRKVGDGLGIGIDGIIGMSVMWNMKMTIDYRTGAVRLVHLT